MSYQRVKKIGNLAFSSEINEFKPVGFHVGGQNERQSMERGIPLDRNAKIVTL
jgi:hypothetical protein